MHDRPHCRGNAPRRRSTQGFLDNIGIRLEVLAQVHAEQATVQSLSANTEVAHEAI